jgi:hypothetical protein
MPSNNILLQCTFPEFPGCFYCDTSVRAFKIAEYFHFVCSCFAGMLALSVVAKLIVARRVVFDELSSPTTASPAGLLCMTLNIVFAGRGMLGMVVVTTASCIHLCLAIWFIYIALAYHIMPEPSWFPNTTGIGISAVKTWLYHPMAGRFLMAVCFCCLDKAFGLPQSFPADIIGAELFPFPNQPYPCLQQSKNQRHCR